MQRGHRSVTFEHLVLRSATAHNVPPLWANTATQVKLGHQL